MVTSLTEYVQIDKCLLEAILREVGELRKLADTLLPVATTVGFEEEGGESCSVEFAVKQKELLQV